MNSVPPQPKTKILLVEDNKIDARLTAHALQQLTDWPTALGIVDDGEKALQFLRRESLYADANKPDLVILDLNLPKRDGSEVLQSIRASENLRSLLVFIFSSSPVDIAEELLAGVHVKADCYFEKPHQFGTYFSVAAQMRESYLLASRLKNGATAG